MGLGVPVESITASLLVCVRVRPLLRDEVVKGHKDVLQVMDNKLVSVVGQRASLSRDGPIARKIVAAPVRGGASEGATSPHHCVAEVVACAWRGGTPLSEEAEWGLPPDCSVRGGSVSPS